MDILTRFLNKIEFTDDCWIWAGYCQPSGYGRFGVSYKAVEAHRVSYELFIGIIPEGLEVDHLCRNRGCVRPDHLELVTHIENMRRGKWDNGRFDFGATHRNKTRCPQGHEYTKESVYFSKKGWRKCKVCGQIRDKERYWRKKNKMHV